MSRRQLPRTTAAILDAATFLPGEIAVDTTNDELRYDGDGSTVGGIALARKDGANLTASAARVTSTGSTTARTLAARFADVGNVKDFGAVGNISTTNDTAAFAAALAVYDAVYVPPGTYRIEGLVVPANKKLFGAGINLTFLRAGASTTYVVSMGASSVLEGMEINGNNLATHGVRVSAVDFVQLIDVSAQYCTNGFYFNDSDTALLHHTASDNNTRGIYADESFVNCKIIGHVSNADGYGFYSTYTTQQAQAVRLHQCLFITNTTAGIYFAKDAFVVNITDCIVDDCTGNALYFGTCAANTGADVTIQGGYFYSTSPALVVKPTWLHVTAMGAVFSGAQTTQVVQIDATSSTRAENILFKGCRIGSSNASGKGIAADSPNGLSVEDCDFTSGGSSTDIAISTTYSSGSNPAPIVGPNNIFRKGGTPITGTAYVFGNIGYAAAFALPVALGGTGQETAAEAVGELTQALTEDTSPVASTDMLAAYDASADTGKKLALERVATMARGLPGYATGRWISGECVNPGGTGTGAVSADILYTMPFIVGARVTWTTIGLGVTAGSGNARLGIYRANTGGVPDVLVLDAGVVDVSGTGEKTISISQALEVGFYYLAVVFSGTPTVRIAGNTGVAGLAMTGVAALGTADSLVYKSHAYAALPSPFGAVSYLAASVPILAMKC